jgi:hypothetical protein
MGSIMKYAVYMDSGVYVSVSPKTAAGIQKFIRGTHNRQAHRQKIYIIRFLLSFKNNESS